MIKSIWLFDYAQFGTIRASMTVRWRYPSCEALYSSTPYRNSIQFNGLVEGKNYRKTLYLMVKTMVSCRFSLQPIKWYIELINGIMNQQTSLGGHHLVGIWPENGYFHVPLVNVYIANWKDGKTHYFDWAMLNSYVKLPEVAVLSILALNSGIWPRKLWIPTVHHVLLFGTKMGKTWMQREDNTW